MPLVDHHRAIGHVADGGGVLTIAAGADARLQLFLARGRCPGFVWLARGVFTPSPEEIIALALGRGERVARFVRVRLADEG